MPRAFPFRSLLLSLSLSLSFLSIADEKLEGFINSVASGEASRLCEQRDPTRGNQHASGTVHNWKRKSWRELGAGGKRGRNGT